MKIKQVIFFDFIETEDEILGTFLYPFNYSKEQKSKFIVPLIKGTNKNKESLFQDDDDINEDDINDDDDIDDDDIDDDDINEDDINEDDINEDDINEEDIDDDINEEDINDDDKKSIFIKTENLYNLLPKILEKYTLKKEIGNQYYILVYGDLNKLDKYISNYLFDIKIIRIDKVIQKNDIKKINITYRDKSKKVIFCFFTIFYSISFNIFTLNQAYFNSRKEILKTNLENIPTTAKRLIFDIIVGRLIRNFEDNLLISLQLFFKLLTSLKSSPFDSINKLSLHFWTKYDRKTAISLNHDPKIKKFINSILRDNFSFSRTNTQFISNKDSYEYQQFLYNAKYLKEKLLFPKNINNGVWVKFTSIFDYKDKLTKFNYPIIGFVKIKITYKKGITLNSSFLNLKNGRKLKTETTVTHETIVGVFSSVEVNYALTLNIYDILPLSGYFVEGHYFLGRSFIKKFYKFSISQHTLHTDKPFSKKEYSLYNKETQIFRTKLGTRFVSEIWQNLDNSLNDSITSKKFYKHFSIFLHSYARIYTYTLFTKNSNILKIDKSTLLSLIPLPKSLLTDKNRGLLYNIGRYQLKNK